MRSTSTSILLLGLVVVFFVVYFPTKWLLIWLLGGSKWADSKTKDVYRFESGGNRGSLKAHRDLAEMFARDGWYRRRSGHRHQHALSARG